MSNDNFQDSVPFEETILTDISNRVANKVELALWKNTTATGATEYNSQCFQGINALITSGNGATQIAFSALTTANALDVFLALYQAIPENSLNRDDLVIFCGYDAFRTLTSSLVKSSFMNLFDFSTGNMQQGPASWGVILPSTNVRVVPTQGLTGVNKLVAGPAGYIMIGFNAEAMTIKSIYDPFEDVVRINLHTTYGVGVFDVGAFAIAA